MVERLIALALLGSLCMAGLVGCSDETGPKDPVITEEEKAADQAEMYTPEERERLTPPPDR